MRILRDTLRVGARKPFRLLHMSDTHLYLADARDDERKQMLARNRTKYFTDPTANLSAGVRAAREENALIVHTGDLIDFVSAANLDAARRFTEENDCFFAAGNHEFSLYVGEAFEDAAYRAQSLDRVNACFRNDIRFSSREINGVDLVAVDNSYYLFEAWQLERLREECEKGLPVILLMHTPLYAEDIAAETRRRGAETLSLMAAPEGELLGYSEYRLRQQRADEITREAMAYIQTQRAIRAILTGHLHYDYVSRVTPTLCQYMTGTDSARLIDVE